MHKDIIVLVGLSMLLIAVGIQGDGWTHMTDIPVSFTYDSLRYAAGCAVTYDDTTWIYIFGGNYNGYIFGNVSNRIYK